MPDPTVHRPPFAEGYTVPADEPFRPASWRELDRRLVAARNYWISTTTGSCTAHAVPVWGIWSDNTFWFSTSPHSLKARNIAREPRCVIHLESGDDVVILSGTCRRVAVEELPESGVRFVTDYHHKYGVRVDVRDPQFAVYEFTPTSAMTWAETDFPNSNARWSFRSGGDAVPPRKLHDRLTTGGKSNSLGEVPQIVSEVLADEDLLPELFNCLFVDDAWARMRASDALEKVCRQQPAWLLPYRARLLGEVSQLPQASIQWHLAQILGEIELTPSQQQTAIAILSANLTDPAVDWIVASHCMETLTQFALDGTVPTQSVVPLLQRQLHHRSKAVAKRATKLLDKLEVSDTRSGLDTSNARGSR